MEYGNVRTLSGAAAVVRNDYLPAREMLTAVGPVEMRVPKVRDRSGAGVKFSSALVPPYVRRSKSIAAALPWLYLKGISTGDMREALAVLVGEEARGLSPNVVSRLKAEWAAEYAGWLKRDRAPAATSIGGPMASTPGCAKKTMPAPACWSSSASPQRARRSW